MYMIIVILQKKFIKSRIYTLKSYTLNSMNFYCIYQTQIKTLQEEGKQLSNQGFHTKDIYVYI